MRSRALLLPHHTLPELWRLKYLALLFDCISLPHPDDQAVLNPSDWIEKNEGKIGRKVIPAAQMPFLRDPGYAERYAAMIAEIEPLRHRGALEVLPLHPASKEDAKIMLRFVADTISNGALVEAAVPDRSMQPPPFELPTDTLLTPTDIELDWIAPNLVSPRIVQAIGSPKEVQGADVGWSTVAWLRLGSTAKFLRRACMTDAVPTAVDDNTSRLLLAIATGAGAPIARPQQQELAFAWDILNPLKLREHLKQMSWKEVIDLRRELLPVFSRIRTEVQTRIDRLGPYLESDLQQYRTALAGLRKEFEELQAKELESMRSLSVKALFTIGSAASVLFVTAGTWPLVATILGGGGLSAPDLQSWFHAWRGKRRHALYPIFSLESPG